MAGVVQRVAASESGQTADISHSLDAQAAGNGYYILSTLGDHSLQALVGLGLVAEEVSLSGAGNGLTQTLGDLDECLAIGFVDGFKFLETLVAGDDEEIVDTVQYGLEFVFCLQPILGIVFQFLTFPKNDAKLYGMFICPRVFTLRT